MSLFLILLAAGDSKRFKSSTPKPYHVVNNKTVLEHSLNSFKGIKEIRQTVIVYNSKHKKYLSKLKIKNAIKIVGGKTRQQSTFAALKKIKTSELKNKNTVLILCGSNIDYRSWKKIAYK